MRLHCIYTSVAGRRVLPGDSEEVEKGAIEMGPGQLHPSRSVLDCCQQVSENRLERSREYQAQQ